MNKVRDREQLLRPVSNENAEPELTAFENAPSQEPPAANSEVEASTIQMKAGPSVQGGAPFQGKKGSSGLPIDIQAKAEAALQIDLSGITLVENSSLAAKIGALAFVRGREMHFAPGQYQPNTDYGRSIIYHEIGHLVPAGKADAPTTEIAGLPVNNDPGKEALADALGRMAANYTLPKTKQAAAPKAEGSDAIQAKLDVAAFATSGTELKEAKRAARRLKAKLNGHADTEEGVLTSIENTAGPGEADQLGVERVAENAQGLEADATGPDGGKQAMEQGRQVAALYKPPMSMQEAEDGDGASGLEDAVNAAMPLADQVESPPPAEEGPTQLESEAGANGGSPSVGNGRKTKGRSDKLEAKQAAKAAPTVTPKTAARPADADPAAASDTPQVKDKAKPKAKQPDTPLAPASVPTTQAPAAEAPSAKAPATAAKAPKGKSGPKAETKDTPGEESANAGPKRPKTAAADPEFQGVVQHVAASAETQATHDAPEADVEAVEGAAVLPQSDQKGEGDRKAHLEGMEGEAEKPKRFEAATFKEKLKSNLTQLEAKLPKDSDEAEKFKQDKPIDDVKDGIQKDVQGEKEKISGPLEKQAKKSTPPAAGLPTTPEVPLQAKKLGKAPAQLNAAAAIPKRLDDQEISLDAESGKLDDMMAQGELTDEQLAKSNEPSFLGALESKNAAKAKAKAAPGEYRGKEAQQLNTAKGEATAAGQKGLVGMHEVRLEKLQTVQKAQKGSETAQEQERAKVKAQFTAIYDKTKTAVAGKLEELSNKVTQLFDTEAESAKKTFEKNVEERLDKIYGWTRIDEWIFGEDKEAIAEAFRLEKETFIQTMDTVLDRISVIIADGLNAAMDLIAAGRAESKTYYDSLDATLKAASKADFDAFNGQYDALEESVREKENELAQGLAQSYEQNVAGLEETFEQIKQEVSAGWIQGAIDSIKGVIDTIKKLRDMFTSLLSGAIAAIEAILSDPIGFLSNLIDGVKQGFLNFGANIQQHLMTGLVEWLTGTLSGAGITVPEDVFSLGGIFNLSMQVMGLTYDYFRGKAVNLLGEPVVAGMETTVELFNAYRAGGPGALWEEVKDQFGDIKEVVIDAIKDMVITQVMNAGIKWIMGLLSPVGAFIKAAMAIVDLVQFFMQRAAQIMELVQAFIQGIRAIAAGNVAAMAAAIERALGRAVPVLIGFLASLLGLGDLSSKVQKIINKIRKRIDKEIERVIKKMKKFFKGEKPKKQKPSKDDKKNPKGKGKDKNGSDEGVTAEDRSKHQKIAKAVERELKKPAKKPTEGVSFEEVHRLKRAQADSLEEKYSAQLKGKVKLVIEMRDSQSDKKDGDIDFTIRITPNDTVLKTSFEVDGNEKSIELFKFEVGASSKNAEIKVLYEKILGKLRKAKSSKKYDFAYLGQVIGTPNDNLGSLPIRYRDAFEPSSEADYRFSLVLGVNLFEDFDGENEKKLRAAQSAFNDNHGYPLGLVGMLWLPNWVVTEIEGKKAVQKKLKPKDVLKRIDKIKDAQVKADKLLEIRDIEQKIKVKSNDAIPYGALRDKVNNHKFTRKFSTALRGNADEVYVHIGDADAMTMKVPGSKAGDLSSIFGGFSEAFFAAYDKILRKAKEEKKETPQLVSGGYRFTVNTDIGGGDQLRAIANFIDQQYRQAAAKYDPTVLYFPEPNTLVKLVGKKLEVSFGVGRNEGETMIKNLRKKRKLKKDDIVWDNSAAITTLGERFYAKNSDGSAVEGQVTSFVDGNIQSAEGEGMTLAQFEAIFKADQMHATSSKVVSHIKMNSNYFPQDQDKEKARDKFADKVKTAYKNTYPHLVILGPSMKNQKAWENMKDHVSGFVPPDNSKDIESIRKFYTDQGIFDDSEAFTKAESVVALLRNGAEGVLAALKEMFVVKGIKTK